MKLPLIWSKMHLHHDSLVFLPLASRFATFSLGHARKSNFNRLSFFSFSFLFDAVIDLLLDSLAVKKTSKKASS